MNDKIALEVQLLGWKKSTSNQPPTVTIALLSDGDMEFFESLTVAKGKTAGQIMSAAFILSPDDSQHGTVEPKKEMVANEAKKVQPERCPQAIEYHEKNGRWPSNTADAICKEENFYRFLISIGYDIRPDNNYATLNNYLKLHCDEIGSKSELDTNHDALTTFKGMLADYRKFVQNNK